MKNVTISLDDAVVAKARVAAAKQGKSLSRFVSELVEQRIGRTLTQKQAWRFSCPGRLFMSWMRTERLRRRTLCMGDLVFVDTNVFVYARDDRFPEKQAVARRWLAEITARDIGVISPQIIGELHNVACNGRMGASEAESHETTSVLETWSKGQTDLELLSTAWDLRQQTRLQ